MLSATPVGLTLRFQDVIRKQLMGTESGDLRLRSPAGLEIRLSSGNRIEIDSPTGERMSLGPDMETFPGRISGTIRISTDKSGALLIQYPDGIQQRLHARAHDIVQLCDHIRSRLQKQL